MKNQHELKDLITQAMKLAIDYRHTHLLTEHVFLAILNDKTMEASMAQCGINVEEMKAEMGTILRTEFKSIEMTDMSSTVTEPDFSEGVNRVMPHTSLKVAADPDARITVMDVLAAISMEKGTHASKLIQKYGIDFAELEKKFYENYGRFDDHLSDEDYIKILETHCVNFARLAEEERIEPIIGRAAEINDITEILARKVKSNVLMLGDEGVGKTHVVEGIAYKIHHDDVADVLKEHIIYSMEMGSILAGCRFRGEFEEKIKLIIAAAENLDNIILFVDEAHMISAGGGYGAVDFSSMVKPALSRGKIMMIAATTWQDYRKSFEKRPSIDAEICKNYH